MAEEKDFIDIQREVVLTQSDMDFVKDNPGGLTKEGCMIELKNWKTSSNKYRAKVYEHMLKVCKTFAPTGKTTLGQIIYARDANGRPIWTQSKEELKV